jgi:dihydrolipoamide dehydrogenase
MTTRVTVIGGGPGGYVAAVRAAQLGAEVTVIEKGNVGGVCLNWGCIPTKTLMATTELAEKLKKGSDLGLRLAGEPEIDLEALMDRKEKVVQGLIKGIHGLFKHHDIRLLQGEARLQQPGRLQLLGPDGSQEEVEWDRLILATGSRSKSVPGMSIDGERILSSRHLLSLRQMPQKVLIVGGGVIGCEFASLLNGLGVEVTVVEAMDRLLPLPSVEADCAKLLGREMKKRKIPFMLNRTVQSCRERDGRLALSLGASPFMDQDQASRVQASELVADAVVMCVGRAPNHDDLGLEGVGVAMDEAGWVSVDEGMRTSAGNIYAVGDMLGPSRVQLAHTAYAEAAVAAENAMGGQASMSYQAVPGAIFTWPEIAGVGLTEEQARQQGFEVETSSSLFRTLGKAQASGEIAGQGKIIYDQRDGKILGLHLIGSKVTELIAEGTLALHLGAGIEDIAATIHPHPTLSEILPEMAWKALGRSLHG